MPFKRFLPAALTVGALLLTNVAFAEADAGGVDMSLGHLFNQATPIVKSIMILLILFSVWGWTITFIKAVDFMKSKKALVRLEEAVADSNLDKAMNYQDSAGHPIDQVLKAGVAEWKDGMGEHDHEGLHEVRDRIVTAMRLESSVESRRLGTLLPFLASVGSSSPFIGLFATVIGIMNTFIQIGAKQDTSLSTVAPGIAEALFATGIGLGAAIPAILAYNYFVADMSKYNGRLATAVGVFAGRLSKRKPA